MSSASQVLFWFLYWNLIRDSNENIINIQAKIHVNQFLKISRRVFKNSNPNNFSNTKQLPIATGGL